LRVLGVDPGTIRMGFGAVDSISGELATVAHGCLTPHRSFSIEKRLRELYNEIEFIIGEIKPDAIAVEVIIGEIKPDAIAVEEPFVSKNPKTAIAIGQAQAVVLIAAAQKEISVFRYAPREIKKAVTDYGGSSKEQVEAMVKILLGNIEINGPDDVTDALAVAICHHNATMLDNLFLE